MKWSLRLLLRGRGKPVSEERLDRLEQRDRHVSDNAKRTLDRAERVLSVDGANRAQRVLRDHR